MKRFKPMVCPVCNGMYFSKPNNGDSYDEELAKYLNGEVYCRHCGWVYDLDQSENPDSHDGFNELSLNEYKKAFEQKLKGNPGYDYLSEHQPAKKPHMCPVCGEYQFVDDASYDICPVCGWEDDGYFENGGANGVSLEEAKKDFAEKRRLDSKYRKYR